MGFLPAPSAQESLTSTITLQASFDEILAGLPHLGLLGYLVLGTNGLNRVEPVKSRAWVVLGLNLPNQLKAIRGNLFE